MCTDTLVSPLTVSAWFWNESVWLPGNATWKDLEAQKPEDGVYPSVSDLWLPIILSFVLIFVRQIVER